MEDRLLAQAETGSIVQQVRRCMAGEASAWKELVGSYYRLVYYLCFKFTSSSSDAEDLTQDIFLKLFCSLSRFDSEKGSFKTWIKQVTRNHLVDNFRASQVIRASESLEEVLGGESEGSFKAYNLIDGRPSPEQSFASLEARAQVYAALRQLSSYNRDVVILCDLEERSYSEAAQILGIPVGTVKSRLNRGRVELARVLAPANDPAVTCRRTAWNPDKTNAFEQRSAGTKRKPSRALKYQPSLA